VVPAGLQRPRTLSILSPAEQPVGGCGRLSEQNEPEGQRVNWYFEVLRKYAVFDGRARRKEYWYFQLGNLIVSICLAFIDEATGTFDPQVGWGLLGGVYMLVILVPAVGVTIRRLHDTDRTGWWALAGLIPVFGAILLLIFAAEDGTHGDNRFGPDPKQSPGMMMA
jgi:uncharacterized membrane protein YhaH (DUF805 family)